MEDVEVGRGSDEEVGEIGEESEEGAGSVAVVIRNLVLGEAAGEVNVDDCDEVMICRDRGGVGGGVGRGGGYTAGAGPDVVEFPIVEICSEGTAGGIE